MFFSYLACCSPACKRSDNCFFQEGASGVRTALRMVLPARELPAIVLQAVGLRQEWKIGDLADKFQEVGFRRLHKFGAQENVMMDVIHPNGQSAERKLRRIGSQVHARGRTRGKHGRAIRHKWLR